MGSTTYYETKLLARELTATVRPAREVDRWASASIEERMQRDLNKRRILDEIVPYLAHHPDRLFGSVIVLVPQGSLEFEPLTEVVGKVPGAYRSAVESMGFLTAEHGETVALDGQHRLVALREVITSGDYKGPFQSAVGDGGSSTRSTGTPSPPAALTTSCCRRMTGTRSSPACWSTRGRLLPRSRSTESCRSWSTGRATRCRSE
jgi:hypothetical protein